MNAQEIIDEVTKLLNDVGFVTWTEISLREYITSGQRVIVSLRPDANATITTMLMASGALQQLPSTALRLLDIKRNMGTNGTTPGRPINAVEENATDLFALTEQTAQQDVYDFSYDERTPRQFYVYPPSDGTGWLEISVSQVPAQVTSNVQILDLQDIYQPHLVEWCLYKAYSLEIDSQTSQQRAAEHEKSFYNMLGIKFSRDVQFSPSVELKSSGAVGGD